MVTIDIPGQRKRIVAAKHSGDIEFYSDTGAEALDKESVAMIGPWSDTFFDNSTDSGGPPTRQQLMAPGVNKLFGTEAFFRGAILPPLNIVGQNSQTVRRRKRTIHIEVPESSIDGSC